MSLQSELCQYIQQPITVPIVRFVQQQALLLKHRQEPCAGKAAQLDFKLVFIPLDGSVDLIPNAYVQKHLVCDANDQVDLRWLLIGEYSSQTSLQLGTPLDKGVDVDLINPFGLI